jgi:hypothetical protein
MQDSYDKGREVQLRPDTGQPRQEYYDDSIGDPQQLNAIRLFIAMRTQIQPAKLLAILSQIFYLIHGTVLFSPPMDTFPCYITTSTKFPEQVRMRIQIHIKRILADPDPSEWVIG